MSTSILKYLIISSGRMWCRTQPQPSSPPPLLTPTPHHPHPSSPPPHPSSLLTPTPRPHPSSPPPHPSSLLTPTPRPHPSSPPPHPSSLLTPTPQQSQLDKIANRFANETLNKDQSVLEIITVSGYLIEVVIEVTATSNRGRRYRGHSNL